MSADYEQAPIPESDGKRRGRWADLVDALIAAEGKALVVRDPAFHSTSQFASITAWRGFRARMAKQADGSYLVWVVRRKPTS